MTDVERLIGRPGELHIGIFAQDQVWVDVRGVPHALDEMSPQYRANVIRHLREHAAQYRRAVASSDAIDRVVARDRGERPPVQRPIPDDPLEWIDSTPLMRRLRALTPRWEDHATEERERLTDGDTGRWLMSTETSRYLIDLDTRTITRFPGDSEDALDLRRDDEVVPLLRLSSCERGASAVLLLDVRGDGVATLRMTTPVRRITRADAGSPRE